MARSDLNLLEQAVSDFVQAHQLNSEVLSRLHIVPSMPIVSTRRCDLFYPDEAFRKRQTGEVLVGYDVGKHGEITNVHVVKSSGWPLVDQAAITCASTQWRNTPAMIENTPLVWPDIKSSVDFEVSE
jgi:TonB family protein